MRRARFFFLSTLLVLVLSVVSVDAQQSVVVDIKTDHIETVLTDFRVAEVIDARSHKEFIGMVKTGLGNKKRSAVLSNSLESEIQDMCDALLGDSELKKALEV